MGREDHHCPGQSGTVDGYPGNCRWTNFPGRHCEKHQNYCYTHKLAYMKNKYCVACDKATVMEERRRKRDTDKDKDTDDDFFSKGAKGKGRNRSATIAGRQPTRKGAKGGSTLPVSKKGAAKGKKQEAIGGKKTVHSSRSLKVQRKPSVRGRASRASSGHVSVTLPRKSLEKLTEVLEDALA